jgi:hypothetical protein
LTSPQHKKLKLKLDIPDTWALYPVALPFLASHSINIFFISNGRLFMPFVVLPPTKPSFQCLTFCSSPLSRYFPKQKISSLREMLKPAVKIIIYFNYLHALVRNLYFSLLFCIYGLLKSLDFVIAGSLNETQKFSSSSQFSRSILYPTDCVPGAQ